MQFHSGHHLHENKHLTRLSHIWFMVNVALPPHFIIGYCTCNLWHGYFVMWHFFFFEVSHLISFNLILSGTAVTPVGNNRAFNIWYRTSNRNLILVFEILITQWRWEWQHACSICPNGSVAGQPPQICRITSNVTTEWNSMKDVVALSWTTAKRYILLTTVDLKRHTYVSCYTHDEKYLKIIKKKNKIICAREDEKLKLHYIFCYISFFYT